MPIYIHSRSSTAYLLCTVYCVHRGIWARARVAAVYYARILSPMSYDSLAGLARTFHRLGAVLL